MTAAYRERFISSREGLSLYFRDYGDPNAAEAPLVCLGGLTRNAKDFGKLAERYGGRRRVVCPDYRGRGRSDHDPDWRHYTASVYVDDLFQLMAAANIRKAVLIGTSLGGLVAMAMAVAAPSLIAGVVLNDIGPDIGTSGLQGIVDYISHDRPQPDLDAAEATVKSAFPTISSRDPGVWRKLAENSYRLGEDGLLHFDWDVAIVRPILQPAEPTPDLWPVYGALRNVPTLLVHGAQSLILSADCVARMRALKPDLETVTVPETGHAPTLMEPEIAAPMEAFLART